MKISDETIDAIIDSFEVSVVGDPSPTSETRAAIATKLLRHSINTEPHRTELRNLVRESVQGWFEDVIYGLPHIKKVKWEAVLDHEDND